MFRYSVNPYLTHSEQFGTGVLIHPFFSVDNLGAKRAKKFNDVLLGVANRLPPSIDTYEEHATVLHDKEEDNRLFLTGLLSRLSAAGPEREMLRKHLESFQKKFPSKIKPVAI